MSIRPLVVGLVLALCIPAFAAVDDGGSPVRLRLAVGSFDPAGGQPGLPDGLRLEDDPGSGVRIVQFGRAIDAQLLDSVRALGVETIGYLPERAYLVRVPEGALGRLDAHPAVRWSGPVEPGWKIAPDLGVRPYADDARRSGGRMRVTVDLFPGEDARATEAAIDATGATRLGSVRFSDTVRYRAVADRAQVEAIARIPAVQWIEEAAEITTRNETTKWVIQENVADTTPVWDRGLHGEGQVIGHIDGRIDMNSCWFRDATDNTPGPGHRKVIAYRSNSGLGADSHGTHTAGTSAGDQFPLNGVGTHNGTAYEAKISHSNLSDIDGSGTAPSNLYDYLSAAHDDGARVHTNSWGDDGTTAYTTWTRDIDLFSYDFEDSLVLFAVTNTSTLRTPENAKNVLAVGASNNGTSADFHCSGGRGPTSDGRRKPEIYAPGCSIVSARNASACSTRTSTGTSMACPAVTGAGALVRQYFEEGWYPSGQAVTADGFVPSAALVKATLLNSTADMTGVTGYPSNLEGWGRVLLEDALYFGGDVRALSVLADVRNADGLATGQQTEITLVVEASDEPLKVTAAWTEPPAALLAAAATINDLDLEVVSPGGTVYLGNDIDPATGQSVTGGVRDPRNNVEMVLIDAPATGEWTVRISGTAVNEGLQGYAVVASGQVEPFTAGALRYASHVVQDDAPLGNADGIVDPGETVVLPLTLRNSGSEGATGAGASLTVDRPASVRLTTASATFPTVPADGAATSNAPHYRFTVAPDLACGTVLRFDGAVVSSVGEGAFSFRVDVGQNRTVVPAGGLPLTLPKKSSTPTLSTLDVPDAFTIQDAQVSVDIAHQDVSELVVQLTGPAGVTVGLHDRSGAGTADLVATFDRDRQPDGPGTMNDFDGTAAQGTWTLAVLDDVGGPAGAGTIRGWSLELTATSPIRCAPLDCGADPVPAEVADLRADRENGTDVALSWAPVAGASGYRVWRSDSATFESETFVGSTPSTTLVDTGAAGGAGGAGGAALYYRVRAVNSCEWEGP